jgi:hypothetical protein
VGKKENVDHKDQKEYVDLEDIRVTVDQEE